MSSSKSPSVSGIIKSVCDIMRRGNKTGAMQYVPALTRILFLRILDDNEEQEEKKARTLRVPFTESLEPPFRWRDWAAPDGAKRIELEESGGSVLDFANTQLLPYLKKMENSDVEKCVIISQIVKGADQIGLDNNRNFLDALDKIHQLRSNMADKKHSFTLSQAYEELLLKMGEKNNDGGQFYTPREVIRAIVRVINPKVGETIYDPCCGTGGFLAQAFEYMEKSAGKSTEKLSELKNNTFYGREKEDLVYPIVLANLMLHHIDRPHIWHGNTLTSDETDSALFEKAPEKFDVVLTNPPFGGKESKSADIRYGYKSRSTQLLFLQEIVQFALKDKGRCGMVIDEGLLFQQGAAFTKCKQWFLEECNLWCVVSLPPGVFVQAGAGIKTNLLFFTKGSPTRKIWYYDLSEIKVAKRTPLTLEHFNEFFQLLPKRADSANSWTVDIEIVRNNGYNLKATNPNKKSKTDNRTPVELQKIISDANADISAELAKLRRMQ